MKVIDLLEQDEWKNQPISFDDMVPVLRKKIKALQHKKDILTQKFRNETGVEAANALRELRLKVNAEIAQIMKQIRTIERTAALQ